MGWVLFLFWIPLVLVTLSYVVLGSYTIRPQYEDSLAKWRAQNIEEYEAVIENRGMMFSSGTYTVTVHDGHLKSATVLDRRTGQPMPVVMPDIPMNPVTIEGQFERVDSFLESDQFSLESFCTITFDSSLGYPSLIDCHPKPWALRTDSDTTMTVKRLKI